MKLFSKKRGEEKRRDLDLSVVELAAHPYKISVGNGTIVLVPAKVILPEFFGGAFKKGDLVLAAHVTSTDKRKVVGLFKRAAKVLPELKKEGFKGVYGDTPNDALRRFAQRFLEGQGFQTKEAAITREARRQTAELYKKSVFERMFPARYARKPVKRIVALFP